MNRLRSPFRIHAFTPLIMLALSTPWLSGRPSAGADAVAEAAEVEIVESAGSYEAEGKTIAIERYEPKAPGTYPAVLVVHGAGGLTVGGPMFRRSARDLARHGYVAHVVHYFDATGTRIADPAAMRANFPTWLKVLAAGITNAAKQPNVDASRVGMVGFSLGSYLSLSLSMFDTRVLAVVEYFGGMPDGLVKEVKSLPPILILHGDSDRVVPVSQAKGLEALCKAKKVPYEIKIYPGEGHGLRGGADVDASRRALEFLETHVKAARPGAKREAAVVPNPGLFAESGK